MFTRLVLFIIFSFSCLLNVSAATKPNITFEIAVVESLPENISLDMSLSEIAKLKEDSRIGEVKKKIYGFLSEKLSPLLNKYAGSEKKDLLALASNLPIDQLIKDLQSLSIESLDPNLSLAPADFMILILPKTPESQDLKGRSFDQSKLYSNKKASVIDVESSGFNPVLSFEKTVNKKVEKSLHYAFHRNYIELNTKVPFFVGALFNVHLEGGKTWIRTQVLSTVPTDKVDPFLESNEQADLKTAHYPSSPTEESLKERNDFPGVIVESLHRPKQKNAMFMNIKFGSLAKLKGTSWKMTDELKSIESGMLTNMIGVGWDFFTEFNVPYLYGDFKSPKELDGIYDMTGLYKIRINIHEVNFDVNKIEIEKIRVSVKLIPVEEAYLFDKFCEPMIVPFPIGVHCYLKPPKLPTLEVPSASDQFTEEGNKIVAPLRDKVKTALEKSPEQLLQDPEIREEVLKFVLNFIESKRTLGRKK